MKKISKKNIKKCISFVQLVVAIVLLLVGYFFYDVKQVPQNLYETQIMPVAQNEAFYVSNWCDSSFGHREYVLSDKTRVDCLTKDYAIEFDFAKKWAESVGQSLYYAKMTNKMPAVALILTDENDWKYVKRVEKIDHNIKIFLIKAY